MLYSIGFCSPEVLAKIKDWTDNVGIHKETVGRTKYPFKSMAIGQAFAVPFDDVNEAAIRLSASCSGKKLGKKFKVIKHTQHYCYEVARIA